MPWFEISRSAPSAPRQGRYDAVQQKLTDQWSAKTSIRNAGDHLLTGLLFDDAGHRDQGRHPLSLLIVAAMLTWSGQDGKNRIGDPRSRN